MTPCFRYAKHVEKDPAFERRFQQVFVAEPSVSVYVCVVRVTCVCVCVCLFVCVCVCARACSYILRVLQVEAAVSILRGLKDRYEVGVALQRLRRRSPRITILCRRTTACAFATRRSCWRRSCRLGALAGVCAWVGDHLCDCGAALHGAATSRIGSCLTRRST